MLRKLNLYSLILFSISFSDIYNLSYYWFSLIGIVIVFVLGITISLLTGKQDVNKLERHLYMDIFWHLRKNKHKQIKMVKKQKF